MSPGNALAGCGVVALSAFLFGLSGCARESDMAEKVEMPDTMPVVRAMEDARARDSMLDTMPGGEMVRGDSTAAMELLRRKRGGR